MRPPRTHGQKFVLDQLKRAIQLPLSDVLVYIGCNIDLGLFFWAWLYLVCAELLLLL